MENKGENEGEEEEVRCIFAIYYQYNVNISTE